MRLRKVAIRPGKLALNAKYGVNTGASVCLSCCEMATTYFYELLELNIAKQTNSNFADTLFASAARLFFRLF
jgi:hypothetical protein